MKQLALVTFISTLMALAACSKPVTTVKDAGSTRPEHIQSTSNDAANIQADISTIQTFGQSQEQYAVALQQRLGDAMQKQDNAALKNAFEEFRAFVLQNNQQLAQLSLKSPEGNLLRQKMIENSQISLEMSEIILAKGSQEAAIQAAEFQPLQAKAMQAQQELSAISEQIYIKLHGQPPSTPNMMPQASVDHAE